MFGLMYKLCSAFYFVLILIAKITYMLLCELYAHYLC